MKLLSLFLLMVLCSLCVAFQMDASQVNTTDTTVVHAAENAPDNDVGKAGEGEGDAEAGRLDAALKKLKRLSVFRNKNKKMSKRVNKMEKKFEQQNDIVERLRNETSEQGKALAVHDTELSEIEGVVEIQSEADDEMKRNLTDTQEDLADQISRIFRLGNETIAQQEEMSLQDEEINRLQNLIEEQNQGIFSQAEVIREQKEEVSNLHQDIAQIKTTLLNNQHVISKIAHIESKVSDNANQIAKIAPGISKIAQNERIISNNANEITQLKAAQASQGRMNSQLDAQIKKLSVRVYFSAYTTHSRKTVNNGETLVLERTHINFGNNYNPSTGIFTCGTPGVYEFTTKARNYDHHTGSLGIYKNNYVKASLHCKDKWSGDASASVILYLDRGDRVQVKSERGVASVLHGSYGHHPYVLFSGKLLSAA